MANLNVSDTWPPIYQLEEDDPVLGGPDGMSNLQPSQLAARTQFLRLRGITPWDGTFAYPLHAYVQDGGNTWKSMAPSTGVQPGTDPAKWVRWGHTDADFLAVKYDQEQTLTAEQKQTARKNIGVAPGGSVRTITAAGPTVLTAADAGLVIVDATANNVDITMPAVNAVTGAPLKFKFVRLDATANTVTVTRAGADTFMGGGTSFTLTGQGDYRAVEGDAVSAWIFTAAAANSNATGFKTAVRFTTTGNVALAGLGTQAGGDWGGALTAGDRILPKDQATGSDRGIYIAAAGAWARATDADGVGELTAGALVVVQEGVSLAESLWELATDGPITIGTTSLTFVRKGDPVFSSAAENAAGVIEGKSVDPLGIREAFNAAGNAPIFACRAWVNWIGVGAVSIRGSGNVSGVTDNGVGDYTVNFATAMPSANYATAQMVDVIAGSPSTRDAYVYAQTAGSCSVRCNDFNSNSLTDAGGVRMAVFH